MMLAPARANSGMMRSTGLTISFHPEASEHVDHALCNGPNRFTHKRSHSEVRDVMVVHHVKVDHVGAGRDHRCNLVAEAREVRGQNARSNPESARSHCRKFYLD